MSSVPEKFPPSGGALHRKIDIKAEEGRVVAWLEDDFHHFGVIITHDGSAVTDVQAEAKRFPISSCPGARVMLRDIIGMPLEKRSTDIGKYTNMRMQCTHMYDIAGLAVALAANGGTHRRYHAVVPDVDGAHDIKRLETKGKRTVQLFCDDELVVTWDLDSQTITGPEPYAGVSLAKGFRAWSETLGIEEAEWVSVLRRAVFISGGRLMDVDAGGSSGAKKGHHLTGGCYSHQPNIAANARKIIGSTLDHTEHPERLLSELET